MNQQLLRDGRPYLLHGRIGTEDPGWYPCPVESDFWGQSDGRAIHPQLLG